MNSIDLLKLMDTVSREQLWMKPYVCYYIFMNLECIEKHILIRLLYGSAHADQLFVKPEGIYSLKYLNSLELISVSNSNVELNSTFRNQLIDYFESTKGALKPSINAKTLSVYDWEYLYTPLIKALNPESDVHTLIPTQRFKFLKKQYQDILFLEGEKITEKGLSFLFSDAQSQMWFLLRLLTSDRENQFIADRLCTMIRICVNLESNRSCNLDTFNLKERADIERWEKWGIISILDKNVTLLKSLQLYLISSHIISPLDRWNNNIFLESNFCMYTYTTSPILVALINCFSKITTILPDMCVSQLTRYTIISSFQKGIATSHIMTFLKSKKHYMYRQIHKKDSNALNLEDMLSDTKDEETIDAYIHVEAQLALWEAETQRFKATKGVYLKHIEDVDQFNTLLDMAEKENLLIWSNSSDRSMFIHESGKHLLKGYF